MKIIFKNMVRSTCMLVLSALYISYVHTSEKSDVYDLLINDTTKVSAFLKEAERIVESQEKLSQESKEQLSLAKKQFFEVNETLNHISSDSILDVLKKQDSLVLASSNLTRQAADASLGITFIQEDIQTINDMSDLEGLIEQIITLKERAQKDLFQIRDTIDDMIITTIKTIHLITEKIPTQHALLDKNVLASLKQTQHILLMLMHQNMIDSAKRAADLIVQIGELLSGKPKDVDPAQKAKELENKIKKMLPPPPPEPTSVTPVDQPTTPQPGAPTDVLPITPTPAVATPAAQPVQTPIVTRVPIAPGKGLENVNKINNKLSSALRRLENIKKYYHELDKEERAVIRKKAENIAHDYESSFVGLVQRIQQVKQSYGNLLDPAKVAPFNTFIDLFNKLVNSVKSL